jgi:ribosomal protein S3AE
LYRNKRLSKGKKGLKKKVQDPFARKDWYSIKVCSFLPERFLIRAVGDTRLTEIYYRLLLLSTSESTNDDFL